MNQYVTYKGQDICTMSRNELIEVITELMQLYHESLQRNSRVIEVLQEINRQTRNLL